MNTIRNITVPRTFFAILILFPLLGISCKDKPNNPDRVDTKTTKGEATSTKDMKAEEKKVILFFGDSLTAGYGLEKEESFPSLVQERIDSLGLDYNVVNAGLSGETSSGGKSRIDWVLQNPVDIFVLELGANDMLRGLDLNATEANLRAILDTVRAKYPEARLIIAGMQAPPNMGKEYMKRFAGIFGELAEEYEAGYIPFLLEGVAGNPELNLPDDKHPNARGQKIVLNNVWEVLKNYL